MIANRKKRKIQDKKWKSNLSKLKPKSNFKNLWHIKKTETSQIGHIYRSTKIGFSDMLTLKINYYRISIISLILWRKITYGKSKIHWKAPIIILVLHCTERQKSKQKWKKNKPVWDPDETGWTWQRTWKRLPTWDGHRHLIRITKITMKLLNLK